MFYDLIATKKTKEMEEMAKKLGLTLYSLQDLKNFKIVDATNDELIRTNLEKKHIDILLNPHQGREKDHLHFRNSGLNHVLCALANKNNISIATSLDQCYTALDLGKIMQNIMLCRKYKLPFLFLSLAKTPYELRNPRDVISLGKVLGMSSQDAKLSVTALQEILNRKN